MIKFISLPPKDDMKVYLICSLLIDDLAFSKFLHLLKMMKAFSTPSDFKKETAVKLFDSLFCRPELSSVDGALWDSFLALFGKQQSTTYVNGIETGGL